MSRISKEVPVPDICPLCSQPVHTIEHLFSCSVNPTTLTPSDLWTKPLECARFLNLATYDGNIEWEGRATRRRRMKTDQKVWNKNNFNLCHENIKHENTQIPIKDYKVPFLIVTHCPDPTLISLSQGMYF